MFYFSPEFLLNISSILYIPSRLGNIFKFVAFRLLQNLFCDSKKWCLRQKPLGPPQVLIINGKTLPQVPIITPPRQREITNSLHLSGFFRNSVSSSYRKQQKEKTVGFTGSVFWFCCYNSKDLPNSFLSFYLHFWVYCEDILRL